MQTAPIGVLTLPKAEDIGNWSLILIVYLKKPVSLRRPQWSFDRFMNGSDARNQIETSILWFEARDSVQGIDRIKSRVTRFALLVSFSRMVHNQIGRFPSPRDSTQLSYVGKECPLQEVSDFDNWFSTRPPVEPFSMALKRDLRTERICRSPDGQTLLTPYNPSVLHVFLRKLQFLTPI